MPNRIDLIVHYLACFKAGLVATPLNYRYTHREIDHALAVSGARALLAHVERHEDVAASELAGELRAGRRSPTRPRAAAARRGRRVAPRASTALLESEPLPAAPQPDPAEPAAIFFTSGSTGPAKGVTHTRDSLRWMIASAAAAFELDGRGRLPARLLDVPHRLLPLGAEHALGRRPGGRRADLRQPRAAAAAARAAADGAGDDPGGAAGPGPRPRPAAARLRLAADLPLRLRQGLDRAAARVRRRRRLPDRRGLRDDRGRPGDAEPALGRRSSRARSGGRSAASASPCASEDGEPVGAEAVGRIWIRTRSQHGRLLGGAGGDRGGRCATAGSTPATSPAPTRTATSGSSAARSR